MIIGSDSRSFCHPPLPLAFFSTLFKTRGKGYVYIVNYGCSRSERPSWWRHLLITSTAAPLIRCLPNPCNDILILDNHVTVFNVSILFCACVCVVCFMYLFVGKLWFVDQKRALFPSATIWRCLRHTPFWIQGPRWCDLCMGVPNSVWLFLTFLPFCCRFVFLFNELNTNRCDLVFVILRSIQLYKWL